MTTEHSVSGSCWKAADLRGVFPSEVSVDLFHRIGSALGAMLKAPARVLIAGDFRLSTPALKGALAHGLMATGVDVLDAGQIPTPVAYFAATKYQPEAVLIVTASHNPAEYNGLKMLLGGRPPSTEQFARLRRLAEGDEFPSGLGTLTTISMLGGYERFMAERWRRLNPAVLPELVLDAGNGAWSESAPRVFSALGFRTQLISCMLDGRFPDRPSDCSRPANLARLRERVSSLPNAVGIAWDGDGDRVAMVDETGYAISADQLSMLLVRELFQADDVQGKSRQVVVDVKLASVAQRETERAGGVPLLERTGHAFMRGRMMASGAGLGLDACGHFFFGELEGADDGVFASLLVLQRMQRTGKRLCELLQELPPMFGSPEFRIPLRVLDFERAQETLLEAFPQATVERLDGVRISLPEGTILLRESGTEPVISLRIEGYGEADYEALLKRSIDLLPSARESIQTQLEDHLAPV